MDRSFVLLNFMSDSGQQRFFARSKSQYTRKTALFHLI